MFNFYWNIIKQTFSSWRNDNPNIWCAALSYYTVFSLGPLLLIIVSILGLFLSSSQARETINHQIASSMGSSVASLFSSVTERTNTKFSGILGTIFGLITLILGATGVVGQVKGLLNHVWKVDGIKKPVIAFFIDQFIDFAFIITIGFLLLVSLVASTVVQFVITSFSKSLPFSSIILSGGNVLISLVITTLLFSAMFKILPDKKIAWKDVWIGGTFTGILFVLGRFVLSLYIAHSGSYSAYGAAASLVVLLLWVYYTSQIVFIGAEFTAAYMLEKYHPNAQIKKKQKGEYGEKLVKGFTEGVTKRVITKAKRRKTKS